MTLIIILFRLDKRKRFLILHQLIVRSNLSRKIQHTKRYSDTMSSCYKINSRQKYSQLRALPHGALRRRCAVDARVAAPLLDL